MSDNIFEPKLYTSLCTPSTVHAYSIGIEYMRSWFKSKFKKGYFKNTYVNGSHLFSDYRRFNKEELISREKPMLAILPTIDTDYDREGLDNYLAPPNMLINKYGYTIDLFNDLENNINLGFTSELMLMNFQFRMRLESKSQQLDQWKHMKLWLRLGATQGEERDIDFHIPLTLIFGIASLTHFEIEYDNDHEPIRVKDIYAFMKYLNSHSAVPIIYKLRAINGKSEFFARVPGQYLHITCDDKLSLDEGEMIDKKATNFHIDFNCKLRMPTPNFFYLKSKVNSDILVETHESADIGLYSIKLLDVPLTNSVGWDQYVNTQYEFDEFPTDTEYPIRIDISPLFNNEETRFVIEESYKSGISSLAFMDIKFISNGKYLSTKLDLSNYELTIMDKVESLMSYIVIYVDLNYINEYLDTSKNMSNSRRID